MRLALASATVAGALLLGATACGSDDPDGGDAGSTARSTARSTAQATAQAQASRDAAGARHNDVDVTFAQDMVPHHRQALEMVAIARKKSGLSPGVRRLVQEIGAAQGPEVASMTGWLQGWGEEVPGAGGHSSMTGMLSGDELDQLREADGTAFERLWLQDMVQHHQGAIPMAQTEIDGGQSTDAIALARGIIETQKAEIDRMAGLIGQ